MEECKEPGKFAVACLEVQWVMLVRIKEVVILVYYDNISLKSIGLLARQKQLKEIIGKGDGNVFGDFLGGHKDWGCQDTSFLLGRKVQKNW